MTTASKKPNDIDVLVLIRTAHSSTSLVTKEDPGLGNNAVNIIIIRLCSHFGIPDRLFLGDRCLAILFAQFY